MMQFSSKNWFYLGCLVMMCSILLPFDKKPLAIGVFALFALITIIKNKLKFNLKFFLINACVSILFLISLLYTENLDTGFKKIEQTASLLVFPWYFAFLVNSKYKLYGNSKVLYKLLYAFILSAILLNLYYFLYFYFTEFTFADVLYHYSHLIDDKIEGYMIHPIYLSMHLCLSLIFLMFIPLKRNVLNFTIRGLLVFLIVFFMFLMSKKGPMLAIGLIALFYFFKHNKSSLIRGLGVSIICLCVCFLFINDRANRNFKELFSIDTVENNVTSTNIRYSIYKNAIEIFKEEPLIGYGIGDSKNTLFEKNKETSDLLFAGQYNTHNQYLSFLLALGIIGTTIIIICYIIVFKNQKSKNNYLAIYTIAFYALVMLTENILERQDGVIYFSYFSCFLQTISTQELPWRKNNV